MTHQSNEEQLKGATVVRIFKHSDECREEMGWADDRNEGLTILFSNGMRIRLQNVEGDGLLRMIFRDQNGEEFHLSAKAYNEALRRISPEELVRQMEEPGLGEQ